jgi:3-deoxy-D-manno-octulosonic-acid transferase
MTSLADTARSSRLRADELRAPNRSDPIRSDPRAGFVVAGCYALYDALWILAIVVASPWWLWRMSAGPAFRRTLLSRSGVLAPSLHPAHDRQRILIHGVSVGETKCAEVLVRALERAHPELEIVISATTATGAAMARKLHPHLTVVRFPFDISFVVKRFLSRVDPAFVVLVELEVWPSFLRASNRRGVPVAVVNGRITERSRARHARLAKIAPQFDRLSLICAQDEDHARRFAALGVAEERVLVTGNLKYDALKTEPLVCSNALRGLLGPRAGQLVVVAGSTHAPEESIVAGAWRERARDARLILVPRHVERAAEIVRELDARADASGRAQLLSRLRAGEVPDPARPVVVDSIGELEEIYALADVVFVGGSLMSRGGQNVLEPAAQGKPVIHGPHLQNFAREAALLADAGASEQVLDAERLGCVFATLLANPAERSRRGEAGRAAVLAVKGATARTLEGLARPCFGAISPFQDSTSLVSCGILPAPRLGSDPLSRR